MILKMITNVKNQKSLMFVYQLSLLIWAESIANIQNVLNQQKNIHEELSEIEETLKEYQRDIKRNLKHNKLVNYRNDY